MILVNVDGVIREATSEELEAFERMAADFEQRPKTIQEQINEISSAQLDIAEALTSLYESEVMNG